MKNTQWINILQWTLLAAFAILFSVTSFGTLDMGVVYTLLPDTSGGNYAINLDPDLTGSLLLVAASLAEAVMVFLHRKWSCVAAILLCVGRMFLPMALILLGLLVSDTLILTPYPYVLCILGMASMVIHIVTAIQIFKEKQIVSDRTTFDSDHFEVNEEV